MNVPFWRSKGNICGKYVKAQNEQQNSVKGFLLAFFQFFIAGAGWFFVCGLCDPG
jgi:hypothetical protein